MVNGPAIGNSIATTAVRDMRRLKGFSHRAKDRRAARARRAGTA
ncbi:hypothetical protein ACWEQG_21060 [Microbispora sp. NPDC004025]